MKKGSKIKKVPAKLKTTTIRCKINTFEFQKQLNVVKKELTKLAKTPMTISFSD